MIFAIFTGYCIGGLLAFLASRWLLRAVANRFGDNAAQRKWIWMVGGVFGALALAPAIFVSVMAEGFVEANYPSAVAGFPAVVLGMAAVIVSAVIVATAMGALTGLIYGRSLHPEPLGG